MTTQKDNKVLVPLPKHFSLGPIFAACPQTGPRTVTVGNFIYTIGGFHPVHRTRISPALHIDHGRAMVTLLSFRNPLDSNRLISFSMNEFCRRYARSQGGRYSRDIADHLGDLMDTYFRISDRISGIANSYRILERVHVQERPIRRKDDRRVGDPQAEMWFESATLSPEFAAILDRIEELQHVRLDVLTSIRSPLAQSIYMYIPSRASHHSEQSPFEINITTLLEQVSHPVPIHKSLRHRLFTQNRTPIISQLDGKETLSGVFHVRLAETTDGSDWKFQCWVARNEKPKKPHDPLKESKMAKAFLSSGRTRTELDKKLSHAEPLDEFDLELMERGKIKLDGSQKAFELAKALLGRSKFQALLSEAKGDAIEGRPSTKTPNHRLMSRIMEALRTK